MSWWEEEIDQETALEFLNECKEYTSAAISKHAHDLLPSQFSHVIQNTPAPFMPVGAVVHSSQSRTVWDAIRSIAYGSHGAHFVVTSHTSPSRKKYELLSEMPSVILAPMSLEHAVPGNGYISTFTWAIEMRHTGKLRPWFSPFETTKPSPIFFGEEGQNFFKYTGTGEPKFFWWDDLWRSGFHGNVQPWFNYFFEVPSFEQMATLVALLRILVALHPEYKMDRRMIVPDNCVNGGENHFPHINWRLVRRLVMADDISPLEESDFDEAFTGARRIGEWKSEGRRDECFIAMHAKMHTWRTNPDDGEVQFLLSGPDVRWPKQSATRYRNAFNEFGYDANDLDFASRMFATAYGVKQQNLDDVPFFLEKKLDQIKGF